MLPALGTHFEATQGAMFVPGLYRPDEETFPFGAIGLAAAAVRHGMPFMNVWDTHTT